MERVSIDTIGPLPQDDRANCYIIVIIDNFSRFIELYPVPNAGAEYAAKSLVSHIGRYGAYTVTVANNMLIILLMN